MKGVVSQQQEFDCFLSAGDFNRTLVILFGDHGPRFGPLRSTIVGRVAARYPMQLVVFPKWFRENYPESFSQVQVSKRYVYGFLMW